MAYSVCHFEVLADDLNRAKKFYGDAFGWQFEPWGPPDFFIIRTGNSTDPGIVEGALAKRNKKSGEGLSGFRCTITVPKIGEAIKKIEAAGGTMTSGVIDIPSIGRVASFRDVENNEVAVMEYVETDPRHVSE